MRALEPIAVVSLAFATLATLACGASNYDATYARVSTTSASDVRVCRGDPPTLPCRHVDVGR